MKKLSFILATLLSITAFSVHADVDTAQERAGLPGENMGCCGRRFNDRRGRRSRDGHRRPGA